jgi:hypothetical protein
MRAGFWWRNPEERDHSVFFNSSKRSNITEECTYQVLGLQSVGM